MSVDASVSQVSVALSPSTDALWRACYALQNEMILTCAGRRIFPTLEFVATGLDASKFYTFCLHLELVDNKKLRFSNGKWIESLSVEPPVAPRKVWHLNGSVLGSQWMARPFTFDQIRITNRKSKEEGNSSYIHLHTQHRYIPVISVYECTADFTTAPKLVNTTRIPHSEFITVTAYHKEEINTLKTNNNPYSTGSRKDRRRDCPSLTSSEDSYSESSVSPPPEKKLKQGLPQSPSPPTPANFPFPDLAMFQKAYYNLLSQMAVNQYAQQYAQQCQFPFGTPFLPTLPLTPPVQSPALNVPVVEKNETSEVVTNSV